MIDVLLSGGDIPAIGDLSDVSDISCLVQLIDIELGILAGTYFADIDRGVRWIGVPDIVADRDTLLGQKFDRLRTIREMSRALRRIPNVASFNFDSIAFDAATRTLAISYTATTDLGITASSVFSRGL